MITFAILLRGVHAIIAHYSSTLVPRTTWFRPCRFNFTLLYGLRKQLSFLNHVCRSLGQSGPSNTKLNCMALATCRPGKFCHVYLALYAGSRRSILRI